MSSDPKAEILALSNYADFSKDGKLSINGIFDEIYSPKFPSQFVRGFLVFTIARLESNKEHTVKVTIKSPKNENILEKDVILKVGTNGKGNFIAELVGLPLPSQGLYNINLQEKGKDIGSTAFTVIQVKSENEKGRTAN